MVVPNPLPFYLYDTSPRRHWSQMLPDHWQPVSLVISRRAGRRPHLETRVGARIVAPSVLLIHPDPGLTELSLLAEVHPNVTMVTVSGGDRIGVEQPQQPLLYRRQARVEDLDEQFQHCLRRFFERWSCEFSASDARPNEVHFAMLEPEPFPEDLVAAYLVLAGSPSGNSQFSVDLVWPNIENADRSRLKSVLQAAFQTPLAADRGGAITEVLGVLQQSCADTATPSLLPTHSNFQGAIVIPSRSTGLIGQLRHSWLENEVINRRCTFVARMHATTVADSPSAGATAFAEWLRGGGSCDHWLTEVDELRHRLRRLSDVEELLNQTALTQLSATPKAHIVEGVRSRLRARLGIDDAVEGLDSSADRFVECLKTLRTRWSERNTKAVQHAFAALQDGGRTLYRTLGELPAGLPLI